MIDENIISQFRNIIDDIEENQTSGKAFLKAWELSKVVLENTTLDNAKLKDFDILDGMLEIDSLVKAINTNLASMIGKIDEDLKEFKDDVLETQQRLDTLQNDYNVKLKKLKKLQEIQPKINNLQKEISQIDTQIKKYEEIGIEKVTSEHKVKSDKLDELAKTKSEELKIYKKHLEINLQIDCRSDEIVGLSNLIEENISKMDEKIKCVLSNVEKV